MSRFGLFDIVGPIMVGPSSSHTAGAAKIGYIARKIFGKEIKRAKFLLHGSFAKTYQGHGTDRALVAGVMLLPPDDENIKYSFDIAKQKGIDFTFEEADFGDVHANTVDVWLEAADGSKVFVMGSSIGGGKVVITKINSIDVEITCEYATLITKHYDKPGAIAKISTILADHNINIAFMKVFRHEKGEVARLIVEVDGDFHMEVMKKIRALDIIIQAQFIDSLKL